MHKYLILIQAIGLNLWPQDNSRINKCSFYSLLMSYRSALKVMLYIFRWLCLSVILATSSPLVNFPCVSEHQERAEGSIPTLWHHSKTFWVEHISLHPSVLSPHPHGPSTMTTCGYYCYLFLPSIHKGVLSFNFPSHILLHLNPPHSVMTGFPFLLDTLFIKIEPIFPNLSYSRNIS